MRFETGEYGDTVIAVDPPTGAVRSRTALERVTRRSGTTIVYDYDHARRLTPRDHQTITGGNGSMPHVVLKCRVDASVRNRADKHDAETPFRAWRSA